MVQLKSTDASSYRIDMLDIKKLEYHASVSNKIPMFLIQFLKQDKLYCLLEVNELLSVNTLNSLSKLRLKEKESIVNYTKEKEANLVIEENTEIQKPKIKSSKNAREKFFKEREEKYGKRK